MPKGGKNTSFEWNNMISLAEGNIAVIKEELIKLIKQINIIKGNIAMQRTMIEVCPSSM